MKAHIHIIATIWLALSLNSCKKSEGELSPSGIIDNYSVPQGNNTYDQTIVGYYQKYGTYLLYEFSEKDAYWTPTDWKKPLPGGAGGSWSAGTEVAGSNPENIPAQLELLDKSLFQHYPNAFLKTFLPVKILLCSKVDSVYNTYVFTPVYTATKAVKKVPAHYNYDNIAVNYGDATISTMTAAEKLAFLARVNLVFIQSIISRGLVKPTSEFINSADYITAMTTQAQAYGKGIILSYSSVNATADWNAYITAMVTYSEADLNKTVVITNTSAVGILNPTKDTTGSIKKRYSIVRNYFIDNYQVDLQKIGNASRGL
ncbi:putative zinc-binding metallopeptidase [Pedobacter sp. MC2016-24]|uniref:putative zinc-binding metallopeptidase n=1 Tax=Pedobacter sp. MC2016-24 TaxID=2780090 RepID=UPI001882788F|nr:putative zinc-binding metallopeptidase [Pedobacter sp. MC2016-24]MBE9601547.1 hypothetical protein [Pedobacter sp. MC2016-24]